MTKLSLLFAVVAPWIFLFLSAGFLWTLLAAAVTAAGVFVLNRRSLAR